MKPMFLDPVLNDHVARAICWMLIHSLWQGVLAAALAAIVIACTRRTKAATRYNLLMLTFLLLLVGTGVTFVYELGNGRAPVLAEDVVPAVVIRTVGAPGAVLAVPRASSVMERAGDFLNAQASVIAGFWLLCLTVQLLRLTGGLYQMGRIRRNGVHQAPEGWGRRLTELCVLLHIRKKVRLLESESVGMPVTFGFLKPSILIPLGMLTGLPADQVETILLHELAHIRRNDYLSNLLLHITESVFFFNPGIRWIASRIRQEREACCDDIVLVGTPNRNSYLEALIAFREQRFMRQAYRLQLGLGKTDLLWRIRRMLEKENKKLHVMEKALLSVGLMLVLAIGLVGMNAWRPPFVRHSVETAGANASSGDLSPADTSQNPDGVQKVPFPNISKSTDFDGDKKTCKISATDVDGNTFRLTKVNGEITEMVINGNVMAQEDYDRYLYIFERIEKHREAKESAESDNASETADQIEDAESAEAPEGVVTVDPVVTTVNVQPVAPVVASSTSTSGSTVTLTADTVVVDGVTVTSGEPTPPTPPAPAAASSTSDRWIRLIIRDLMRNGVVDNDDPLSFTLDKDGLVVNGTRQSDDLFRLLKAKYINSPKDHFIYSRDGGSTHVEVWVE